MANTILAFSPISTKSLNIAFTYNETIPAASSPTKTTSKSTDSLWTLSVTRVVDNNDSTEDTSTLHLGDDVWYCVKATNTGATDLHLTSSTSAAQNLILVGDESTIQDVPSNDSKSYYVHFTVDEDTLEDTSTSGYVRYSVSFGDQSASLITPVERIVNYQIHDKTKFNADGSGILSYVFYVENESKYPIENYKFIELVQNNNNTLDGSNLINVNGASYDSSTKIFTVDRLEANSTVNITCDVVIPVSSSPVTGIKYPTTTKITPVGSKWNVSMKRVIEDNSETLDTTPLSIGDDVWYEVIIDNTDGTESISAADASNEISAFNFRNPVIGTFTQGTLTKIGTGSTMNFDPGEVLAGTSVKAWIKYTVSDGMIVFIQDAAITTVQTEEHTVSIQEPIKNITSYSFTAENRITGDTPATDSKFNFILTAGSKTTPMPLNKVGGTYLRVGEGAKDFWFDGIIYTSVGTYTYTLSEENSGIDGYSYDSNVFTIQIKVTKTDYDILVKTVSITDSKGNPVEKITFTNSYKAKDKSNYTVPNTADKS